MWFDLCQLLEWWCGFFSFWIIIEFDVVGISIGSDNGVVWVEVGYFEERYVGLGLLVWNQDSGSVCVKFVVGIFLGCERVYICFQN